MYKRRQISLFLCGLILPAVVGDCFYKECFCTGPDISCYNLQLKEVPQKVGTSTTLYTDLDFELNFITRIPTNSLPSNLQQISLMENPLTTIDDSAFDDSANTLQSISFSNANFSKLPDALQHLKVLTSFSIYDSIVSDWNVDVMKTLGPTINSLNVENCTLNVWPSWVQYLSNLTQLSVSRSSFSTIPDDALDKVANTLTSLSLIKNQLTSVPKALSKMSALTVLLLQENKISDVSWLPETSKLSLLSLNANNIFDAGQLSAALMFYKASLTDVDVQYNHLSSLPDLSFLTVPSLDFSQNAISDPISGSMPLALNSLSLNHNILSVIPRVFFTAKTVTDMDLTSNAIREIKGVDVPPWMEWVDLGYNLIAELTDTSFPENSSIEVMHLNNNPLLRISINTFKNLPRLSSLNMQNTKLTRLPLGLVSATSLQYVDFTGSSNLICTCLEKSLGEWVTSLPPDNVAGDCGVTSIITFFTTFSQSCPE